MQYIMITMLWQKQHTAHCYNWSKAYVHVSRKGINMKKGKDKVVPVVN
jgi:hypothetical protein